MNRIYTATDRVQGIAYYFDEHKDSLADPEQCALDAPLMQTLLVNTIRVYTVNSTLNHTACMDTFKSHGIYVLLGLATAGTHIDGVSQTYFGNYPLRNRLSPLILLHQDLMLMWESSDNTSLDSGIVQPIYQDFIRVLTV